MSRRLAPQTNLPFERGAFIGRERQLDQLGFLVASGVQLITISGPRGIGKTRLALRAAGSELPRFGHAGGIWFVDATDVKDPASLVRNITLACGAFPDASASTQHELQRALHAVTSRGPSLVILDGLPPFTAVELIEQAVMLAPTLTIMVTSDVALGVADERVLHLDALDVPNHQTRDAQSVLAMEGVQLFLERAAEVRGGYAPSLLELRAVAQIVRQLDGIPLAIEVAAARLRGMTASELLERLPRNIGVLAQASPLSPTQTSGTPQALTGTVAWSIDLLAPWEIDALSQMAIFRGGWDGAAAQAVIDLSAHPDAPAIPMVIAGLVEKALVRLSTPSSGPSTAQSDHKPVRFDLPGAVRSLVEARVDVGAPESALAQRHAAHYLKTCGTWAENVDGYGGITFRDALASESDNLLAVVQRALTADPPTLGTVTRGLHGTLALEPVLLTRGPHTLLVELLTLALSHADTVGIPPALLARALEARARTQRTRFALRESLDDLKLALAESRRAQDPLLEARVRANIGTHHLLVHDLPQAAHEYEAALRVFEQLNDRRLLARAEGFCALLLHEQGDLNGAIARYTGALRLHRDVGDHRWEAIHTGQLAAVLLEADQRDRATMEAQRAMVLHRDLGNHRMEGTTLITLGDLDMAGQDVEAAYESWDRGLEKFEHVGDPAGEARVLARLSAVSEYLGHTARAEAFSKRAHDIVTRSASPTLHDVVALLAFGSQLTPGRTHGEAARAAATIARVLKALGQKRASGKGRSS